MGSKIIVFLGVLASIFLVLACSLFCSRSFYGVWNQLTDKKIVEQKITSSTESKSRKEPVKTASKVMTIVKDKLDENHTSDVVVPQKRVDVNKSEISTKIISIPQANDQNNTAKKLVIPQSTIMDNNSSHTPVKVLSRTSKVNSENENEKVEEIVVSQPTLSDNNSTKILTEVLSETSQDNSKDEKVEEGVALQRTHLDNNSSEELPKELSTVSESKEDSNKTQKVVLAQEVFNENNISSDEKNMITKENNQSVNTTIEKNVSIELNKVVEKIEKPSSIVAFVSPHFSYIIENDSLMVDALLSKLDENGTLKSKIDTLCKTKEMCILNMSYKKEVKSPSWNAFALDMVSFFESEKSKVVKVSIRENMIDLDGELTSEASRKKLKILINKHNIDNQEINNLIKIKHIQVAENVQINDTNNSSKLEVKKQSAQKDINTLLQKQKIHFGLNSGKIQNKSKRVLNKIVAILKTLPSSSIEIEGHTDASGDKKYNLWLSKQRANAVKKYLISRGISKASVNAKGFGSSRPKLPSALYNKVNRRVEIHIKRR